MERSGNIKKRGEISQTLENIPDDSGFIQSWGEGSWGNKRGNSSSHFTHFSKIFQNADFMPNFPGFSLTSLLLLINHLDIFVHTFFSHWIIWLLHCLDFYSFLQWIPCLFYCVDYCTHCSSGYFVYHLVKNTCAGFPGYYFILGFYITSWFCFYFSMLVGIRDHHNF